MRTEFTHGGASSFLHDDNTHFTLTRVRTHTKDRNKGHASGMLKKITKHADEHKKPIKLHAIPDSDDDIHKLINLYKKHDFEQVGGKESQIMIRHPKPLQEDIAANNISSGAIANPNNKPLGTINTKKKTSDIVRRWMKKEC